MMFRRVTLFVLLCILAVFFLHREQERGTFVELDRGYVDTLLAYSGERIGESSVTLLRLDKDEAKVFQEWPLTALDYGVLLKNLKRYGPKVVALEPTLFWEDAQPYFESAFLKQAAATPHLVAGAELELDGTGKGAWDFKKDVLTNVSGDLKLLPEFTGVARSASAPVLAHVATGFTAIDFAESPEPLSEGSLRVPMVARRGDVVIPSMTLRILMEQYDTAHADVIVRLGESIQLGNAVEIPVDASGSLLVFEENRAAVVHHNATLLVPIELPGDSELDPLGDSEEARSLSNQVVIFGNESEEAKQFPFGENMISRAGMIALAVSTVQSQRFVRPVSKSVQKLLWATLTLLGAWGAALRKGGWLVMTLIFVFWMVGSIVVFQSSLLWVPPGIPILLIIFMTLVRCFLPSHDNKVKAENGAASPVSAK